MSLTGPPPPLPASLATPIASADGGALAVVGILDARGPDRLASSITDVLHAASGPGNIITGKVAELRPDGTVFLTTSSGAELSFRHPPEVPLELGSTITLRLVATVPAPQAVLLAVDGRSVADCSRALRPAAPPKRANLLPRRPRRFKPRREYRSRRCGPPGPSDFGIAIPGVLVATLGEDAASRDGSGQVSGRGVQTRVPGTPRTNRCLGAGDRDPCARRPAASRCDGAGDRDALSPDARSGLGAIGRTQRGRSAARLDRAAILAGADTDADGRGLLDAGRPGGGGSPRTWCHRGRQTRNPLHAQRRPRRPVAIDVSETAVAAPTASAVTAVDLSDFTAQAAVLAGRVVTARPTARYWSKPAWGRCRCRSRRNWRRRAAPSTFASRRSRGRSTNRETILRSIGSISAMVRLRGRSSGGAAAAQSALQKPCRCWGRWSPGSPRRRSRRWCCRPARNWRR